MNIPTKTETFILATFNSTLLGKQKFSVSYIITAMGISISACYLTKTISQINGNFVHISYKIIYYHIATTVTGVTVFKA